MSWYYMYYLGVMDKNGKIYPVGIKDDDGRYKSVVSNSSSFESDLHYSFIPVKENMVSDEFRKQFEYREYDDKEATLDLSYISYLPFDDLGSSDYIKKGYFLISDVTQYLETKDSYDLFYDKLTPVVYAAKLSNETVFGSHQTKKDDNGEEYIEHSASEYMFFAYPEYNSKEYDVHVLKLIGNMIYDEYELKEKELKMVAILSQG